MKIDFPNFGDRKTVTVESLMRVLKKHATSHPDAEYRDMLMTLMGMEAGRNVIVNMLMMEAEKRGVEIVDEAGGKG